LNDLLKDMRHLWTQRHPRKLYLDPITRKSERRIVGASENGAIGVCSLSKAKTIERSNFSAANRKFKGWHRFGIPALFDRWDNHIGGVQWREKGTALNSSVRQ
ncbi:MAG: hypothetical protein R6X05_01430, partial [Desulfobacterales bacterium]